MENTPAIEEVITTPSVNPAPAPKKQHVGGKAPVGTERHKQNVGHQHRKPNTPAGDKNTGRTQSPKSPASVKAGQKPVHKGHIRQNDRPRPAVPATDAMLQKLVGKFTKQ